MKKKLLALALGITTALSAMPVMTSQALSPPIPGDVNLDWTINIADLVCMQNYLLGKGELDRVYGIYSADINNDNSVDVFDYIELRKRVDEWCGISKNNVKIESRFTQVDTSIPPGVIYSRPSGSEAIIRSVDDLENYLSPFSVMTTGGECVHIDSASQEVLDDLYARYDDEFFSKNVLLLNYLPGTAGYEFESIKYEGDRLVIKYYDTTPYGLHWTAPLPPYIAEVAIPETLWADCDFDWQKVDKPSEMTVKSDFTNAVTDNAITSSYSAVTQLTEQNDVTTAKSTAVPVTQTATGNPATAVQTNKPVQTHAQVTMPEIPGFTPSVTALTFPTKPETPTRTKPVYTSKAVSVTTARKTTVASPIATTVTKHEGESPSLAVTTEQLFPILTESSSASLDYENNVTTIAQLPSVDVPKPIVTQVTTEINYEPPSVEVNDYTVYPSAVYSKSDNIIDLSGYFDDNTAQEPTDSVISVDDLINSSDYIILGKVDEIIYTQVKGRPYTQENITVYQVYKGDILHERDRISVYIPGGYMPVSEFERLNNTEISSYGKDYIYSSGGNKNHQIVGDIRIFFINDSGKYIPDGAFELTTKNDISIFQARGSEYISSGNNALKFNIKNLLNL